MTRYIFLSIILIIIFVPIIIFLVSCSSKTNTSTSETSTEIEESPLKNFYYTRSSSNDLDENSSTETTFYLNQFNKKLTVRIVDDYEDIFDENAMTLTQEEYNTLASQLIEFIEEYSLKEWSELEESVTEFFPTDSHSSASLTFELNGVEYKWNDSKNFPDNYGDTISALKLIFDPYF